jgi:hypothetical protein
MRHNHRFFFLPTLGLCLLLLTQIAPPSVRAYIEAQHSFGQIVALSTNIVVCRVTSVNRTDNAIIYEKVRDIKGVHPQQVIRHKIGTAGFEPREWQTVMRWAEVGKEAVFMHNGSQAEMCIDNYWYQIGGNPNDPNGWWTMTHAEPFLLRTFCGRPSKLATLCAEAIAGKEVIVPCMVDGNLNDIKAGKARIQRLRGSLKLQNYDAKRDFVGWGGEDFRRLSGMPGFTHLSALGRVDPDAQSVSILDFNNDGKVDICLGGAGRIALLQNSGEALGETSLPGATGCRSAVWADYNGDGLSDLLLASPTGPKLFTNLGKEGFRDDSYLLPSEAGYNTTCAAWIDQDSDGKPDVLLGNGWHGLRLYRNKGKTDAVPALALGDWHYIGPFNNEGRRGFATAYPPEKEIDLTKKYPGKGEEVAWQKGKFVDGQVNSLQLFKNNDNVCVYVYREISCKSPMKLPVSLGSDDGLKVWLNGKEIVSQDQDRACSSDQATPTLDLKAGKNQFLMKITQGSGDWAFYFAAKAKVPPVITWTFADVSDEVGLGEKGIGSTDKGDTLTVCDFDGDGNSDFLYGAGKGLVVRNLGDKFDLVKDSGIEYETGRVGPVVGDYDGDGMPDLFLPLQTGCRLLHNDGKWKFSDMTAKMGLDKITDRVTSAAFGDMDNDGKTDLVLGCLRSPNRLLRNLGDKFEDASEKVGLNQKIFNTQAVGLVDLNGDGALDVVFNNEGQDAVVLLANPEVMGKNAPVSLRLASLTNTTRRVAILDATGKIQASHHLSGGDGRGGQVMANPRFALPVGKYKVELLQGNGEKKMKELVVADSGQVKADLDEKTK